jgi:hypothetical protein
MPNSITRFAEMKRKAESFIDVRGRALPVTLPNEMQDCFAGVNSTARHRSLAEMKIAGGGDIWDQAQKTLTDS